MRDPERIDSFIKIIKNIWKRYPDLRFGQLLLNAFSSDDSNMYLYYLEDDEFLKTIRNEYKKMEGGNDIGNH